MNTPPLSLSKQTLRERLSQQQRKVRGGARGHAELAVLGQLRSERGYPRAGLTNLLEGFKLKHTRVAVVTDEPAPALSLEQLLAYYSDHKAVVAGAALHAQIAEALRLYVRDERLSQPRNQDEVVEHLVLAIAGFNCAVAELEAKNQQKSALYAWVLAHRAAAYTTRYWLSLPVLPSKAGEPEREDVRRYFKTRALDSKDVEAFERAKTDFEAAILCYDALVANATGDQIKGPRNGRAWTRRFIAFLYALRGEPAKLKEQSDFERARKHLEDVKSVDGAEQSSLQRSIAMLLSYDAVCRDDDDGIGSICNAMQNPQRIAAAKLCVDSAIDAQSRDENEFVAPYFGAVSTWLLSRGPEGADYRPDVAPAIQSARVRAQNAISQANAALLGLFVLEAMQGQLEYEAAAPDSEQQRAAETVRKAAIAQAKALIAKLVNDQTLQLDLESQAMFFRDPAWHTVAHDTRFFAINAELEPSLQELRALFRLNKNAAAAAAHAAE